MIPGNNRWWITGSSPMVKGVLVLLSFLRRPGLSWRGLVSVGVVLAYLVLAGEAIHCQYLPTTDHTAQHESPSSESTHSTHCLVANHASATIPSIASLGVDALPSIGSVRPAEHILGEPEQASFAPARAPPFA